MVSRGAVRRRNPKAGTVGADRMLARITAGLAATLARPLVGAALGLGAVALAGCRGPSGHADTASVPGGGITPLYSPSSSWQPLPGGGPTGVAYRVELDRRSALARKTA